MTISKKLFPNASNSLLLFVMTLVISLVVVGCDSCGDDAPLKHEEATLKISFKEDKLVGTKHCKVALIIAHQGEKHALAHQRNFLVTTTIESQGGAALDNKSQVLAEEYVGPKVDKKQHAINVGETFARPLHYFLSGREDAVIESGEKGEENPIEFTVVPDMTTGVEAIRVKVVVTNTQTEKEIFSGAAVWHPKYTLKITSTEPGVIHGDDSRLEITTNDGSTITPQECAQLQVRIASPDGDAKNQRQIFFQAKDLVAGNKQLFKSFEFDPGKKVKKDVSLTFTLAQKDGDDSQIEAFATATYKPVETAYKMELDRKDLIGLKEGNKKVQVTISSLDGSELDPNKLKNLRVQIKRTAGATATIKEATGAAYDFKGDEIVELGKNKAKKELTLDTKNDLKAQFELELVETAEGGGGVVTQKVNVTWEAGVSVEVDYDHSTNQFKCKVINTTAEEIATVKLKWKTEKDAVTVQTSKEAELDIKNVPAAGELEQVGKLEQLLDVDWGGEAECTFDLEALIGELSIHKKSYSIAAAAPKVRLTLKEDKVYKGEEKLVTLVITAVEEVINEGEAEKITFSYKADTGKLMLVNEDIVKEDLQGLTLKDVLAKLQKKEVKAGAGNKVEVVLSINNEDQPQVNIQDLQLIGSHSASENGIKEIKWEGELRLAMAPTMGFSDTQVKENGELIANTQGKFGLTFTNNSTFPFSEPQLNDLQISITSEVGQEPVQILTAGDAGLDLVTGVKTLKEIIGDSLEKANPKTNIFTIKPGDKDVVAFTIKLVTAAGEEKASQKVKWEKKKQKIEIVDSSVDCEATREGNDLVFTIVLQNTSGAKLTETDAKAIVMSTYKLMIGDKITGSAAVAVGGLNVEEISGVGELGQVGKAIKQYGLLPGLKDKQVLTLASVLGKNELNVGAKLSVKFRIIAKQQAAGSNAGKKLSFLFSLKENDKTLISERKVVEK